MGRRMAIWYAGTAAVLLLTATTALYCDHRCQPRRGGRRVSRLFGRLSEEVLGVRTGASSPKEDWPGTHYRIRDQAGQAVAATPGGEHLQQSLVPGAAGFNYRTASGRWFRALSRRVDGWTYEVAFDRSRELELLGRYRYYTVIVLVPALATSSVAGVVIARRGLRPLGQIAETARRIRAGADGRADRDGRVAGRVGRPGPYLQHHARPAPGVIQPAGTVLGQTSPMNFGRPSMRFATSPKSL